MKHLKSITQKTPASAGILNWISQVLKGGFVAYAAALQGQADFRTADPEDGDIGNPNVL